MCLRLRQARTVLLAAHPDDEVIGASSLLPLFKNLTIVHATDGSPENMKDAREHGFEDRVSYARARRQELCEAVREGGAAHAQLVEIGLPDQKASLRIDELVEQLLPLLREADQILTHPYEGGHPDHDACALAAQIAVRKTAHAPALLEFTSYHAGPEGLATSEFLGDSPGEVTFELTDGQRARKQRMIACFSSQAETLRYFPIAVERFRPAPHYDFTRPPHQGQLFYERFDWGMTPDVFSKLAASAMRKFAV